MILGGDIFHQKKRFDYLYGVYFLTIIVTSKEDTAFLDVS